MKSLREMHLSGELDNCHYDIFLLTGEKERLGPFGEVLFEMLIGAAY
jgi:hypothetical protein